jgi:phosphoglycolate phosphatase-like HAD superfamily hydrolase
VRPAESVFVGDSLVDLETARAVPSRFIPVAWGLGGAERLAAASGDPVVASAAELRAALGIPGSDSRPR